MQTYMFFTGDSGDRPINTGVSAVPTLISATGDTGDKSDRSPRRVSFVPTVPTRRFSGGDKFRAIKTGLSPLSPLSPPKKSEAVKI